MTDDPRLPRTDRLKKHLESVRRVNPEFDLITIDFWAPGIVADLRNLRQESGRFQKVVGDIDGYSVKYWCGIALPTEMEVLDATSGRRLFQDGADDTRILDALKKRLATDG